MHYEVHGRKNQALGTVFFTKEFEGFEVESKFRLLTENPVPTFLRFMADIHSGKWGPIQVAKMMGRLPVGLRYFDLQFDFWAVKNIEMPSTYCQVAMVAVIPGDNLHQVAFKEGGTSRALRVSEKFLNPPLVRREERKGDWVRERDAIALILKRFPDASKVATMERQKCFVYVHNAESYRNFSVSADQCRSGSKTLSQVEVEYKGRNGVWLPDAIGYQIAQDFVLIHKVLSERYETILVPTTQTKFEWITGG